MSYMGADDMFKKFTARTFQGDMPIIFRQVQLRSPFLYIGVTMASVHTNGNTPVSRDRLKIAVRAGVS